VSTFRPYFPPKPRVYPRASSSSALGRLPSRTNSIGPRPTPTVTLDPSISCRLLKSLASLLATPVLCFQQLAASFNKIPGWVGIPIRSLDSRRESTRTPGAGHASTGHRGVGSLRHLRNFCVSLPWSEKGALSFLFVCVPASLRSCIYFRMNTCESVSKQRTLTLFRMNTYAKPRGRGPLQRPLWCDPAVLTARDKSRASRPRAAALRCLRRSEQTLESVSLCPCCPCR